MIYVNLKRAVEVSINMLVFHGKPVDTGHWQGVETAGHPEMKTSEIVGWTLDAPIPVTVAELQGLVKPDMPWAEAHFQERVGGEPTNPGEQYKNWPHWNGDPTMEDGKFSHTYQERYWPPALVGIRYVYGNLTSVVELLKKHRHTRQAYLPVFFPEDTGSGRRSPCSLGYQFIVRDDRLHCFYFIRSCDVHRHFRNDVYLTCRLVQWMGQQINVTPGLLRMTIVSFHLFDADRRHYE